MGEPGSDGLEMVEANFEPLEIGFEASGQIGPLACLDEPLEQIEAEGASRRGKSTSSVRNNAFALGARFGASVLSPSVERTVVQTNQLTTGGVERTRSWHRGGRDARGWIESVGCRGARRPNMPRERERVGLRLPEKHLVTSRELEIVEQHQRDAAARSRRVARTRPRREEPGRQSKPEHSVRRLLRASASGESSESGVPSSSTPSGRAYRAGRGSASRTTPFLATAHGPASSTRAGAPSWRCTRVTTPTMSVPESSSSVAISSLSSAALRARSPPTRNASVAAHFVQDLAELREVASHEELGLSARDVVVDIDAGRGERQLLHARCAAKMALADGREQTRAVEPEILWRSHEAVFGRPPVEACESGGFARGSRAEYGVRPALFGPRHLRRCARRIFFRLGKREDGLIESAIGRARERVFSGVADAPNEGPVVGLGEKRRMAGGFVDDVRCRRVREVPRRSNVRGDRQDPARLERLKRSRRDETVHRHGAPAESRKARAHLLHVGDRVYRDARAVEPARVRRVSRSEQALVRLSHDEPPYGLIFFRVLRVVLTNDESSEVRRDRALLVMVYLSWAPEMELTPRAEDARRAGRCACACATRRSVPLSRSFGWRDHGLWRFCPRDHVHDEQLLDRSAIFRVTADTPQADLELERFAGLDGMRHGAVE